MEGSNKVDELKSDKNQELQPQGSDADDFQKTNTLKVEEPHNFAVIDDLQNKAPKITSLNSICFTAIKLMKMHNVDLEGI